MIHGILGIWNYWIVIILMMTGLFIVISRHNLVKKMVGLTIFQTSVFLFYISLGKVQGGTAPILTGYKDSLYSNPLPHVLILTAIVVGVQCSWKCLTSQLVPRQSLTFSMIMPGFHP